MMISVGEDGRVTVIYTEDIDLGAFGAAEVRRASHVEPCVGGWSADMAPRGGPVLGPFARRSEALAAEVAWLEARL